MTEKELRARFEDLTLRPEELTHEEHVRLAWIYLCELPLLDVLRIFPENLRRYAAAIGKHDLYHETISWMYLMIIAERIAVTGERSSWRGFLDANRDLLARDLLLRWYDEATLASEEARRRFVVPKTSP